MGHNLARQLRMLAFVLATALVVTGCSGTAASVSVQEKPAVSVTLTEECAMPIPKEQGRGEPLEDLVPQYAEEYLADPLLKDSVIAFRRWEWNKVYSGLDTVVRENPDHLDAYRLQAEVYLINQHYEAALSQLDRILEQDTTDVHALGVSAIIMHILENAEGEQERLAALEQVNAKAAEAVRSMLEQADTLLHATYTPQPQTDMAPDAITIYGRTPQKERNALCRYAQQTGAWSGNGRKVPGCKDHPQQRRCADRVHRSLRDEKLASGAGRGRKPHHSGRSCP